MISFVIRVCAPTVTLSHIFKCPRTPDKPPEEGSLYVFAGIDKARFRSRVGPNDKVHLYSTVVSEKKGIWKFDTRAEVDNKVVCSASILCADRKA